jgi:hypothetical protein
LPGLNLLTAALVAATFALVWASLEGPPLLRSAIVLLAATTSAVYWSARPHLFTLLLTAAVVWLSIRARRGYRRALYASLPLMGLWANLHGGFLAGFLLLGVAAVEPRLRRLMEGRGLVGDPPIPGGVAWAALVGSLGAVSVNPFGPEMLTYPFRTVSIGVLRDYIQEWQSPDFHQTQVWPFLAMICLVIVAYVLRPRRPHSGETTVTVVFLAMALLAARNIALFAIVVSPTLASQLRSWGAHRFPVRIGDRTLAAGVAGPLNLALIGTMVMATLLKARQPLDPSFIQEALARTLPVRAAAFLEAEGPAAALFNSYNWGGYVVWALYPKYLSFVDGRTDLFDDEILSDYLAAWRGEDNWRRVFYRWDIRVALLEPAAPLTRVLEEAGWSPIYADDMSVVLEAP